MSFCFSEVIFYVIYIIPKEKLYSELTSFSELQLQILHILLTAISKWLD